MDAKVVFTKSPIQQYCVDAPSEELKTARVCVDILSRLGCYLPDWAQAEVNAALAWHNEQTPENSHQKLRDAAEMLWTVIANVSGGDWSKQSDEWQTAAERWRDNYFNVINEQTQRGLAASASPLKEGVEAPVVAAPPNCRYDDKPCPDARCIGSSCYRYPENDRLQRLGITVEKPTAAPEQASASADWIPYDGSGMPVDGAIMVDVKTQGDTLLTELANKFKGGRLHHSGNIIAYRIAKPVTQASADDGTSETDAALRIYQDWCAKSKLGRASPEPPVTPWGFAREKEIQRNRLQRENAELRKENENDVYEHNVTIEKCRKEIARAEAAERELAALHKTLSDAGKELKPVGWIDPYGIKCLAVGYSHTVIAMETSKYREPLYDKSATTLLAAAQERIAVRDGLVLSCEQTISERDGRINELAERIAGLEIAFHVNMLRLRPEMSHAEIDAIISRAGEKS